MVNGAPYTVPLSLSGTSVVVSFPPNLITQNYAGVLTYTLIVSSGGISRSATVTEQVSPFLAVANSQGNNLTLYALSGILPSSGPAVTLQTGTFPVALAFDPEGNLWVEGGTCPSSFLEEFQAPFSSSEQARTFSTLQLIGPVDSLAFDRSGNLWVGERSCSTSTSPELQEYALTSNGLTASTQLHPPGEPDGLAFDASGNLWVGLSSNQGTEFLEYTSPISGTSTPSSYSLTGPYGFGPLAFDTQGNLYSFEENNPAPLEELLAGSSATSPNFTTLFSLTALPLGLAFDAAGNLWVSEISGNPVVSEVQEFQPPFTSATPVLTLTQGLNTPQSLAIWPVPSGLPLN